jgi:type II secretory pathway component PulM
MTAMALLTRIPVPSAFVRAWDRWSSRERLLAIAAAALVLLAAAWAGIWQPMQEDTLRARRELQRDRAALAVARAQAVEITGLQRATQSQSGNPMGGDSRLAVERVLGERALKASLTSLEVKDNRAYITFAAIGFDALVGMLEALAKTDSLRPVEVTLTSRVEPGTVRAEITLAR